MVEADFSVLDLLDLPALEREVFLYLARNGSTEGRRLGEELGQFGCCNSAGAQQPGEQAPYSVHDRWPG